MIIKVCGLREAENIRAVEAAGASWFGFIFYARSPRFVDAPPAYLPQRGRRVGVFVHADFDEVTARVRQFGLHAVQLHGEASPELCRSLRAQGLIVVRALPVTESFVEETEAYLAAVDYFVFDTPTPDFGGSGRAYDHNRLLRYDGHVPFLLSGGLSPQSVAELRRFHHPRCAGYDLNSGFETAPGMKDAEAVAEFVRQMRRNG